MIEQEDLKAWLAGKLTDVKMLTDAGHGGLKYEHDCLVCCLDMLTNYDGLKARLDVIEQEMKELK